MNFLNSLMNTLQLFQVGAIGLVVPCFIMGTMFTTTPDCEAPADVDINLTTPYTVVIDTQEVPGALAYQFKVIINGFCPFVITQYVAEGYINPNAFTHGINPVVQMIEVKARILCNSGGYTEWTEKETLIINQ